MGSKKVRSWLAFDCRTLVRPRVLSFDGVQVASGVALDDEDFGVGSPGLEPGT